jgi:hypothetical protein
MYAGEWHSKWAHLTEGAVTHEHAAGFFRYAMAKLTAELREGAGVDDR